MGIDFEIVAYRGKPAPVERLAELIARYTPYATLFRHATAAQVESPVAHDLHLIAFYDDQGADTDVTEMRADAAPGDAFAPHATAREPVVQGGSLAELVSQAWRIAREAIDASPEREASCAELARALSRGGDAFLLGYADHSGLGIYGQFRDGELVAPTSADEIYGEHEDYVAWPSQQWSNALGKTIDLDEIVAAYFPEASLPALYRVERPEQPIPFDAERYSIGISESM